MPACPCPLSMSIHVNYNYCCSSSTSSRSPPRVHCTATTSPIIRGIEIGKFYKNKMILNCVCADNLCTCFFCCAPNPTDTSIHPTRHTHGPSSVIIEMAKRILGYLFSGWWAVQSRPCWCAWYCKFFQSILGFFVFADHIHQTAFYWVFK